MAVQSFTLRLNRLPSDDEMEAIFEAGLDDSVPEGNLLHVDRDAPTMVEAAWSAARQVATVSDDLHAVRVVWDDLVTLREIAQRSGRTYESARLLVEGTRGPGGFPTPEVAHRPGRLWSWTAVADWFAGYVAGETAYVTDRAAHELRAADLIIQVAAAAAEADPVSREAITSTLREVA